MCADGQILRDREYGIATSDYTIEFASQDISGWVDVSYLQVLTEMKIQGRTQNVTVVFEPYKEIAAHWGVCKVCLGLPARSCSGVRGENKSAAASPAPSSTRSAATSARRKIVGSVPFRCPSLAPPILNCNPLVRVPRLEIPAM